MDGTGSVTDVQVNGTSVLQDGVANVPIAGNPIPGVIKTTQFYGVDTTNNGFAYLYTASDDYKNGTGSYHAATTANLNKAVYYGLAKAAGADMASVTGETVGVYPVAQKSAISTMLNAPESVSGTTPTITALAGVQYVCGEVATLDITLPESGIVDVRFESGSTPTILTITPPTGVTVKWAGGFDPTALEANTTYEINIADGLGVAASWT
jgi:hypothetical protein